MIRKGFTILFNILGFLTFIALIGAATFWYIGYLKNKESLTSTVHFSDVSMTPAKDSMPQLEPVTPTLLTRPKQVIKRTTAYSAGAKKADDEAGICPSCQRFHLKSVTCADDKAFETGTMKKTTSPNGMGVKKRPSTVTVKKEITFDVPKQPQSITWQTADYTPGVGRTVGAPKYGNIDEVSALEQQAIQKLKDLKALEEAADKIRNPKGWESGFLKLLSGN